MNNKKKLVIIFKNFKYLIFKLFYGQINNIAFAKNIKKIDIKNISFKKIFNYKLYNIPNGRLYTDTIHDTGYIYGKSLIEEPSFQYRYKKKTRIENGKASENFVIKNGTPNLLKKIKGSVFSLLTGGAGKNSYWHWLFDVLPRIAMLNKSKLKTNYYLLPSLKKNYQKETLLELKVAFSSLLDGEKYKHVSCNNLIAVDHPIIFKNNPSISMLNIPVWVIEWLRKIYAKKNNNNLNLPRKIFIDREFDSNLSARKIINNNEVKKTLNKLGFKTITLSKYSFAMQTKLFNNAKFVVGLHGGGFANIVFSKPGTKIVEIASQDNGDVILNLAYKCKLNYKRIIEKNLLSSLKYQNSHINVDISKLKQLILSFK